MELDNKISYHISNKLFDEINYVELWHNKIKSKFLTYENYSENWIKYFNFEYFNKKYINYINRDILNVDSDEDKYYDEIQKIKFYPILGLTQYTGSCGDDPIETIIDSIITPFLTCEYNNLYLTLNK